MSGCMCDISFKILHVHLSPVISFWMSSVLELRRAVLFLNHIRRQGSKGKDQANELVSTWGLLPSENSPAPRECCEWLWAGWKFPSSQWNQSVEVIWGWWCLRSSLVDVEAGGLFVPYSLSSTPPMVFGDGEDGVSGCLLGVRSVVAWGHCCYQTMRPYLVSSQGCEIYFKEVCSLSSLPTKSEVPSLLSESVFTLAQFTRIWKPFFKDSITGPGMNAS